MFRRNGKNPLDESPLYPEEASRVSAYKYGQKLENESLPRIFDTPGPLSTEEPLEKMSSIPHPLQGLLKEEIPETTLGEGVSFRGELSFERLLRIDGTFEGELLSQGKVIVGPKGKVKANLNLREAIIEGEIEGNITVQEKLILSKDAKVKGDIRAKSLCVDEGVQICGHVHISLT